jgi:cell division protease FtsH
MAPRHVNTVSPDNSRNYEIPFRSLSPFGNGHKVADQNIGEENGQTSGYKNGNLHDTDETMNEDHQDLEPESGRIYKIASGIILAAIAAAVYKRFGGRRKWLVLSLFSHLKISGTSMSNDNRDDKFTTLRKFDAVQLLKSVYDILRKSLRSPDYAYAEQSSLGLLRTAAQHGIVQRALIGATEIIFNTREGWKRASLPPKSPELMSDMIDLLTKGGCNDISTLPDSFWDKMATPILTALPFIYLAFAYRVLKRLQNGHLDGDGDGFFSSKLLSTNSSNKDATNENRTSFADVAGLDNILPEVSEIVSYLRNPSGFHALGAQPPRGILLHGSPGVGKTMIAKAIAGEANSDAFCVCSGSDFCEMYVGRGAGRIRTLFKEARKSALKNYNCRHGLGRSRWWPWGSTTEHVGKSGCNRPATAIIFIDELDAVAKSRSYGGVSNSNDERDQTLNQLLTEMDGFFQTNGVPDQNCTGGFEGNVTVIVIAATNRAETLDPAILRRFDRQIHVPCPDKKGRMEILKVHAAKKRCRFSTIHWDYLAEETPNFSGSDLKQVVNDAALLAVRQKSKQIEQGHLLQSIQRARTMKVQNSSIGRGLGYSSSSMLPFVYR